MVVDACNTSTWQTEAGGWQVSGQAGIYIKILFQNKQKTTVIG
jgi:hypothetical protein